MKESAKVWWTSGLRLEVDKLAVAIGTSRSCALAMLVRAALDPEGPEAETVRAFRRRSAAAGRTSRGATG